MASSFGGTIKLTGESEYRNALKNCNSQLKALTSGIKLASTEFTNNGKTIGDLRTKNDALKSKLVEQEKAISLCSDAIADFTKNQSDNAKKIQEFKEGLEQEKQKLDEMKNSTTSSTEEIKAQEKKIEDLSSDLKVAEQNYDANNRKINEFKTAMNNAKIECSNLEKEINTNNEQLSNAEKNFSSNSNSIKSFTAEILKSVAGTGNLGSVIKDSLSNRVNELKDNFNNTKEKVENFGTSVASVVKDPTNLGNAIKDKLIDTADKLQSSMNNDAKSIEEMGDSADDTGEKTLKLSDLIKANLLSDAIKSGFSALCNSIKAVGQAMVDIGKEALSSYSDFQQLEGGVKTLFGTEATSVEEYAESVGKSVSECEDEYNNLLKAQQQVFDDANNAYKDAGMSANEYMETVTSFSASLISSLDGDTVKAAEASKQAITDMADNANKMGTDISSIQNAYQGFAKQNYTMLD